MDANSTEIDGRRTDTHARILEVASRHFRERGYSETSMQEIADELGVTKAALYYHFESKVQILRALVEPIFSAVEEILARNIDCSTARARRDFIASLVTTFDAAGPVVASIAIDPRAAADILETVSTSTLVDRIAERLVEGLMHDGRTDRAAAAICVAGALNAVEGMFNAWIRVSGGAGFVDENTRNLMVSVAVAALETGAST